MIVSERDRVVSELRKSAGDKVKVALCDIDGVLRGKYLHKDKVLGALESRPADGAHTATGDFGFCNVVFGWDVGDVCYDNGKYSGWHTGFPDAPAFIDLATLRHVPWDGNVPFFLGDLDCDVCPRTLLRRVLARAAALGITVKAGMEFEWFNFRETPESLVDKGHRNLRTLTPGMFGYSLLRLAQNSEFFNALFDQLGAFRVPLEGLHTETGPGVTEAAILFDEALECADRAVLFKAGTKEIAARFGIVPSFMAKWNSELPGTSGHIHISLWRDGVNLFHDDADPDRMSPTFASYVQGFLDALPEILPMFAPNLNSYKRLVDGYWAPTKPTWGVDNRTVAARVIPGSSKSTRVEIRIGGADVNPYLAMAAAIAAGLRGVEKKLQLQSVRVRESAYADPSYPRLPRTLEHATSALEGSEIARELFGAEFVDHYVRTRRWESNQALGAVTDWELARYFEII